MVNRPSEQGVFVDGFVALKLVFSLTWRRNLTAWIYVPTGVLIILLACFGVHSLISMTNVSFPASVACLVLLFFALLLSDLAIGDRRTRALVKVIDIPAGWSLRYISIFFTPPFVLLPLSPPISGAEVGKIIPVIFIGFVVMFIVTAYVVRGLQLILGSSKRAMHERAEEMGNEDDNIPLTDASQTRRPSATTFNSTIITNNQEGSTTDLIAPPRVQDPDTIRATAGPPQSNIVAEIIRRTQVSQAPLPLSRAQRWATFINQNFDRLTWLAIFLFIGLPVYYVTGYAMPAQLSLNIIAYFAALALPARWRQFLHPVLVSSAVTILGLWTLGLIRGDNLQEVLDAYKTGTNYLELGHGGSYPYLPGAGDMFGSVLDASIVALALPMFAYRQELKRHFFAIVMSNFTVSIASLFGYPALCYAIGISSKRSLAFAARTLTLALAISAVNNLGGDINTVATLAIISGIMGALIGNKVLAWLRIPEDDYVTRGVTLGGNSAAIATALLLVTDPRAAALSSLSMTLFGTITLALTSVPPIVTAIQSLVDL